MQLSIQVTNFVAALNTAPTTREPSEQRQALTRTPDSSNHFFSPHSTEELQQRQPQSQLRTLPAFVRPLPPHLEPEDVQYLADKDALTIPDEQLRNELLRAFIQYVYPSMPILDLADFLSPIAYGSSGGRHRPISLLLFQAVMFVSVTFISAESLHKAGFHSWKDARKTFFRRVRLLYGLDYEPDRLPLLQALLLMTYWYESPRDEKDTWYWMGISLSLVQVLGFHRDPGHLDIKPQAKRLQRRIWWSCFMRDRLLALGIRRPARIKHAEFDVQMLTLDDFEMTPLPRDLLRRIGDPAVFAQDPTLYRIMSIACIDTAKLCVCIGNILLSQYSILGDKSVRDDRRNLVVPRRSDQQVREMAKCDVELSEWHHHLSPECRYSGPSPLPSEQQGGKQLIRLQQALIHMIYLTAVTALHRPRAFQCSSDAGDDAAGVMDSESKVTEAAIGVTDIAYDLYSRAQLCYLSTSSIPAILWATLIHIIGIRSTKEDVRNSSIGRFFQCRQALEDLRDIYASADHAVRFLEAVIRKTDVRIPMLSMGAGAGPSSSILETHLAGPRDTGLAYHSFSPVTSNFQNNLVATNHTNVDQFPAPAGAFLAGAPDNPYTVDNAQTSSLAGDWSHIDIGANLHQALIDFDINPGSFAEVVGHSAPSHGVSSIGTF